MRWMMLAVMLGGVAAGAQSLPAPSSAPVLTNQPGQEDAMAMLLERGRQQLVKAAASAEGSNSQVLNQYDGYYTMLVARVKSGLVEQHTSYDDFFVVVDGELTEVVGGKAEMKPTTPGELRAATMAGGTPHVLRKGDIMHIQAGVPHQTLVPAGKTVVYYVIKVGVRK